MCVAAALVYAKHRNRKGALLGRLGIVAMTAMGAAANTDADSVLRKGDGPCEADIVAMMAKIIRRSTACPKLIVLATVPFNVIKGVAIGLIAFFMYKPLSPLLHGHR
jgi:hypothetical protein